jgi:hypothetical protein
VDVEAGGLAVQVLAGESCEGRGSAMLRAAQGSGRGARVRIQEASSKRARCARVVGASHRAPWLSFVWLRSCRRPGGGRRPSAGAASTTGARRWLPPTRRCGPSAGEGRAGARTEERGCRVPEWGVGGRSGVEGRSRATRTGRRSGRPQRGGCRSAATPRARAVWPRGVLHGSDRRECRRDRQRWRACRAQRRPRSAVFAARAAGACRGITPTRTARTGSGGAHRHGARR